MSAHEGTAQPEKALPLRWKLWFVAALLAALYALCVVLNWTHAVDRIPPGLSTLAHICVTVLVLAGCIDVAITHMNAQEKRRAERDELLALMVDTVHEEVRMLSAAPTVNLHELRQMVRQQGGELQEQVLMGQAMISGRFTNLLKEAIETAAHVSKAEGVEEIKKALEGIDERVGKLERGVDILLRDREADDAAAAGAVPIEDMRLLKRIDDKVRRANEQDG